MESPLPQNNQHRGRRSVFGLIVGLLLVGVSFFAVLNKQYIIDSVRFWQYQPSSVVATIAARDELTDSGRFVFYASQPESHSGQAFNSKCNRKEENTAILGCYVNDRIYLYDVTDKRLDGINEVTAAHEMLHAVYQRLSDGEKATVDKLVEAEYAKLKVNPEYQDRMAYYDRTEPGARDNELHSIIGTEVASVSPELEAHYAKYFSNRSIVTGLYAKYNGVFTALSQQTQQLAKQLDSLSKQIDTATKQYEADIKQLNADVATFNQRADSGKFTSQAQFNAERQALVNRSNSLETNAKSVNALIVQYNQLKDEYNATATQSNDLYKSIDSTLTPTPQV